MQCSPSRRQFLAGTGAVCTAAITGAPTSAADTLPSTTPNEQFDSGVEGFIQELVDTGLTEYDIPGASVAAVTDESRTVTK